MYEVLDCISLHLMMHTPFSFSHISLENMQIYSLWNENWSSKFASKLWTSYSTPCYTFAEKMITATTRWYKDSQFHIDPINKMDIPQHKWREYYHINMKQVVKKKKDASKNWDLILKCFDHCSAKLCEAIFT